MSARSETLVRAARTARADLSFHKKAARQHRIAAREAAILLANIEKECAALGIILVVTR